MLMSYFIVLFRDYNKMEEIW